MGREVWEGRCGKVKGGGGVWEGHCDNEGQEDQQ